MLQTWGRFRAAQLRNCPVASSCRRQSLAAEAYGNLDLCARAPRFMVSRLSNVALALFGVNVIGQAPARARIEGACGDVRATSRPRSPLSNRAFLMLLNY